LKTHCINGLSNLQSFDREHIYQKHTLPMCQCLRCLKTLKAWEVFKAHSQQKQACSPHLGLVQDGISKTRRTRCDAGSRRPKTRPPLLAYFPTQLTYFMIRGNWRKQEC
jgi:PHP family Zn ribbon phosphoesterase